MLAVQLIKLIWEKDQRNPKASAERQKLLRPLHLECDLKGSGIFFNENIYYQTNSGVISFSESQRNFVYYIYDNFPVKTNDNRLDRDLLKIREDEIRKKGSFYATPEDIRITSVQIVPQGNIYRIMWHYEDNVHAPVYRPIRRGRNEDFNDRSSPFFGKNILNETAFVLGKNECGRMMYNYRVTGYEEGPHYELYCVFLVNTDKLSQDTFTKAEYKYDYDRMAYLF